MRRGRRSPPVFPYAGGFAWDWSGWRAHLTPAESALCTWYLDTLDPKPQLCYYDVAVDGVKADDTATTTIDSKMTPALLRMWQRITSKRMDLITTTNAAYQVIEFRTVTKQQTLGEIITYDKLTRAEWPLLNWLTPVIVTTYIDDATKQVIDALDINLIIAPASIVLPA